MIKHVGSHLLQLIISLDQTLIGVEKRILFLLESLHISEKCQLFLPENWHKQRKYNDLDIDTNYTANGNN